VPALPESKFGIGSKVVAFCFKRNVVSNLSM